VHVDAAQAGEAEMVGYPQRLHAIGERLQAVEIVEIERIDRAYGHRHAVQRHRIVAADQVEPVQRAAAGDHVVFRQRLEPAHLAGAGGDLLVMLGPKAQAEVDGGGTHAVDFTPQKLRASAISPDARLPFQQ